jgi:hypothetical protein
MSPGYLIRLVPLVVNPVVAAVWFAVFLRDGRWWQLALWALYVVFAYFSLRLFRGAR